MRGPPFIDRDVFDQYLPASYKDRDTIYGDLSRLIVAFVARSDPASLRQLYAELKWGGSLNVLAIHEAATAWMAQHRPASLA